MRGLILFRREKMKKLFPFMLILFLGAGLFGLPAIPLRPGSNAPGSVLLREDISDAALKAPAGVLVNDRLPYLSFSEIAFIRAVDLICLWSEQYREGLLTRNEFKVLVAGRVALAVRSYPSGSYRKAEAGSMRFLTEKARKNTDRLLMYRELEMGIKKPISLALSGGPLLC
jgi:hypothetical protein